MPLLSVYKKGLVTDMRKVPNKFHQEALTIIILLAPVVKKVDSDIQQINLHPVHSAIILLISLILIHWLVIYPVDSTIQLLNNWGLVIFAGIALKLE